MKLRSALMQQASYRGPPYRSDFLVTGAGSVVPVTGRLVIEDVRPRTPGCSHFAKAAVGERIRVSAVIFRDGHDPIDGRALLYSDDRSDPVAVSPLEPLGNDEWEGFVTAEEVGRHRIEVQAWTVRFGMSGPTLDIDTAVDVTTSDPVKLWVDRERALVGAWYELFPRSLGGFKGVMQRVPDLSGLGFDVLYFPPIHPIGRTFRKGPNNTLEAGPDDPGSPWAIGNEQGGHTAIHPDLGTEDDLLALISELKANGMELALDYALQCSPDHPWVQEHPDWFHHRPDGTIACAENPPKIYQDIYPLNFWPEPKKRRVAMWNACKEILDHWISFGVRIFRVDNPHTKPIAFWEWVIEAVQTEHPDVIFLAEAFTRPHVMARLAEAGFSQSYTYFTWRTEQHGEEGLWAYMEELAHGEKADYMRPNFWPNTPDILSGPLRNGPPSAFALRYVLAATLSPSYGVYSGYELYENRPASPNNEEYLSSEKYQIVNRDYERPDSLAPLMGTVNRIRRYHPALARLRSIQMHPTTNPSLFAYSKVSDDRTDRVLVVVNLDPWNVQDGFVFLHRPELRLPASDPYLVYDELSRETYTWSGDQAYVRLDPTSRVAHIFSLNLVERV